MKMDSCSILNGRFLSILVGIIIATISISANRYLWLLSAIPFLLFGVGIDKIFCRYIQRKNYSVSISKKDLESEQIKFRISGVDYAPNELYDQVPFEAFLIRCIPGPDRPDYWLAELASPLSWINHGTQVSITHLILSSRYQGEQIRRGARQLAVGIAFVTDQSVLLDKELKFRKGAYVAIGIMDDITGE
jgi:hypothetical protein